MPENELLPNRFHRRHALRLLGGGAGLVVLAACGASSKSSNASTATSTTAATTDTTDGSAFTDTTGANTDASTTSCASPIPEETAGPYPGDGSNGPDVLSQDGVVRKDIRSSFGSASGTADGVPLTIALTVLDQANGCTPMPGAAVYVWHCDRYGNYSMYGSATGANYLRGVQAADANGLVTFTSIFPAAYSGRWPHVHFEVYESVDAATSGRTKLATSQLALPEATCNAVYATHGYEQSVQNLAQTSLNTDMVFSDGWTMELATVTGAVTSGLTAKLAVPV